MAAAVIATLQEFLQSDQRAELIARAGAQLTASVVGADAEVKGSTLTDKFSEIFQIAAEMVSRGEIRRDVFQQQFERSRTRSAGNSRTPAADILAQLLFGGPSTGNPATVEPSSYDLALRFYHERFLPTETYVGVIGDLSTAQAFQVAAKGFEQWHVESSSIAAKELAPLASASTLRSVIVPSATAAQSRFTIGAVTPNRLDPDSYALEVLNEVLGHVGSGRMFTNLREQKGYAYSLSSELSTGSNRSVWSAFLAVRPEVTEAALRDMLGEIDTLRKVLVPEAELLSKKRALIAELPVRIDGPSFLLNLQLRRLMDDLPEDYWDGYLQQIGRVTSEDVRRVAQTYLAVNRLCVVAVGDPKILEPAFTNLGLQIDLRRDAKDRSAHR